MKPVSLIIFSSLFFINLYSQHRTENLIVVTLDGMRWHEVFKGIDDSLVNHSAFTSDAKNLNGSFGGATREVRRARLFPFLWGTVSREGQLYGNRQLGSKIDNANPYWFSYPGYNEIFTGFPDTAVNSNDKIWNKNETVLGFLNRQADLKGKVAAFSTWDVFPYILNAPKSGVYVNADVDSLKFDNAALKLINDMQFLTTRPIGVRPDIFTYMAAREYLKAYLPRVLYIAFDETDDFAHRGMYDQYIASAHAEDGMIADLWKTVQSMPKYRNKTTLVVTCDHGRGDQIKANWQHHGSDIADAHEIWLAVLGPDTPPLGEVHQDQQLYQKQIAATLARLMGYAFKTNHPVADPILSVFSK